MLIRFNEISPLGSWYEILDPGGLAASGEFEFVGHFQFKCQLKRKGDDKVELLGRLQATLKLSCDRCLAPYDHQVDADLQMLFALESNYSWHLKDLECKDSDLDMVLLEEPTIDLIDVLRQQLYLSLPMKNLCSEQCRGICSLCGANFNSEERCDCAGKGKNSPFAQLEQLKKH